MPDAWVPFVGLAAGVFLGELVTWLARRWLRRPGKDED